MFLLYFIFFLFFFSSRRRHTRCALVTGVQTCALPITWLLLRASTRLPIGLFFSVSAILMAVLAVVLTGKGIAALQEANVLPSHVLALPRFDLVGFYPTLPGLVAQFVSLGFLNAGFLPHPRSSSPRAHSRPAG